MNERHKNASPYAKENVSHIHKESHNIIFLFLVRYPHVSTRYFDHLQEVICSDASTWNYFTCI